MIICKKCEFRNPDNARHCGGCGDLLASQTEKTSGGVKCPSCGETIEAKGATFCSYCGASVAPQSQPPSEKALYSIFSLDMHRDVDFITKTNGEFILYEDRVDFIIRHSKTVGLLKGKGDAGKILTYYIKDIESCYFNGSQAFVLKLKSGSWMKFSTIRAQKVADVVPKINELLEQYNDAEAQPDLSTEGYSFVMKLNNCVEINDRATAVIGSVKKGSVREDMSVSIVSDDGTVKGTFSVHGIAVDRHAAESANEGDADVALLLFCSADYLQYGDCVCIKNEE